MNQQTLQCPKAPSTYLPSRRLLLVSSILNGASLKLLINQSARWAKTFLGKNSSRTSQLSGGSWRVSRSSGDERDVEVHSQQGLSTWCLACSGYRGSIQRRM